MLCCSTLFLSDIAIHCAVYHILLMMHIKVLSHSQPSTLVSHVSFSVSTGRTDVLIGLFKCPYTLYCFVALNHLSQVAKLWYLVGKISAEQSIRFVRREVRRTGGVQGLVNAGTNIITSPVESVKSGIAFGQVAITGAYNNAMWLKGMLQHDQKQD
jgi:hypothetical protein